MSRRKSSKQRGTAGKSSGGPGAFKDRTGKEHIVRGKGGGQADNRPPAGKYKAKGHSGRPLSQGRPAAAGGGGGPSGSGHAAEGRGPGRRDQRGPRFSPQGRPSPHGRPSPQGRSRVVPAQDRRHQGGKQEAAKTAKGTIDKNQKGFAFLVFDGDGYEDAYISARDAARFIHGDRVEVSLSKRGDIIDVRVTQHRFRELVGRYSPEPGKNRKPCGWLIYERKRTREEVFIPDPPPELKPADWIRAVLEYHPDSGASPAVTGKIVKVYGQDLPASSDVEVIAAECNLFEEHPAQAVEEAKRFTLEIPGKDLDGRTDLRHVPFITIDGETARDFDDAVYVEKQKNGYILWVAIADVSHYVREGTALDKDARARGTSVYFPERAFHMLPRALSEELCSLKPHVPRLSLVAKMFYHENGTRETIELFEAVIQSKRRATYNEIEAEHQSHKTNPSWEFRHHYELYSILRKMRVARGSIDFDFPEPEVHVAPDGEPIDIKRRGRLDAHRLIEEFMIAANEGVTEWIMKKKWPFLYRVHDEPSAEALERFRKLALTVGFHVQFDPENLAPGVLAEIARAMQGHPAELLLNTQLLRSMKQAAYSSTHGIHYGLASQAYTHFTSPIRRYPDLVVHRMLRWALRAERDHALNLKPKERDSLEVELNEIAEHCSYRERLATEAEREALRLKQVRLLSKRLGDEFDATIIGMMDRGMFAQLESPFAEGMISRDSMSDDFYEFNEEKMIFYGRRKRRTFKVGDRVKIQVMRADIERRQADFALIDSPSPT